MSDRITAALNGVTDGPHTATRARPPQRHPTQNTPTTLPNQTLRQPQPLRNEGPAMTEVAKTAQEGK